MDFPEHLVGLRHRDLLIAAEAAARAGHIIRKAFGGAAEIREKGVGDLVSEVDEQADTVVSGLIRAEYPTDIIVSEELQPKLPTSDNGRMWIIDPLDGTSAFLFRAGPEIPSILIALREDGEFTLGLIHVPLTGDWFYSLRGQGAFKNGQPLSSNGGPTTLHESWVEMNHYGDTIYESPEFALLRQKLRSSEGARLVTTPVPHSGLAMRLLGDRATLGAVIHDNNPEKVKQGPWDTAAPQAIIEEAGGAFMNLRGERYDFHHPEPILIAANRTIATQVISLLEKP